MTTHEVRLGASFYPDAVVIVVIHRLSHRAGIAPRREGDELILTIVPRTGHNDDDLVPDLLQLLSDEALRQKLDAKTTGIRALIMAQLFSDVTLTRPGLDGDPPGFSGSM